LYLIFRLGILKFHRIRTEFQIKSLAFLTSLSGSNSSPIVEFNCSNSMETHYIMDTTQFSAGILDWYAIHKRDLPWREVGLDPYKVVVAEIMLQQTQVPRVIEKYKEFLGLFPTIYDLAQASRESVILAWSGLGYNRRAIMLQQFAQEVVKLYDGKIPQVPEALIKLSGIGPYAAGSIASFAFNRPEPAIDVNVRRIYMRYFHGRDEGLPMGRDEEKKLYTLVKSSIPDNKSCELHNALMDFGSLVCLRDAPRCTLCVLRKSCAFFPLYTVEKEKVLFVAEKKVERGVSENGRHIPNRIFRGRIVEFVRKHSGEEVLLLEFGCAVKKDYVASEEEWLVELCLKLDKEGMITFVRREEGKMEGRVVLGLGK